MSYESRKPEVVSLLHRARSAGLEAAIQPVADAVRAGLKGGFTSGDFDTGESVEHVKTSAVTETTDGAAIRVGTDLVYNLVWEVGHVSLFSRKFERVEVWMPALVSTRDAQQSAFIAGHRKVMG